MVWLSMSSRLEKNGNDLNSSGLFFVVVLGSFISMGGVGGSFGIVFG